MAELVERGQARGLPIAAVYDVKSFIESPQTRARGFFTLLSHPVVGDFLYPGPPYKWSETPAAVRRAAPLLGEHNEEIYGGALGLSSAELKELKEKGVI